MITLFRYLLVIVFTLVAAVIVHAEKTSDQAEIWLELETHHLDQAAVYLKMQGVTPCDEIEPLPEGLHGFWISNPASIVHLVESDKKT
ncbi:MAG: hypothetical protein ACREOW_00085 [Thermodesulfobacteriota bacterium]